MQRILLSILIVMMSLLTSCVARTASAPPADAAVAQSDVEVVAGGEFNKFFPAVEGEFDLVYTQEKEGFAQAKLNQDGEEMATLSVSDTANNPDALDKFKQADNEIAGYPAVAVGNLGTAILVDGRFQIQIRSKTDAFGESEREEWLANFDLSGIAGLQ